MKEPILNELRKVTREGIDNLIQWLETETDFFEAPCSAKHHLNTEGGLAIHSYNVFQTLREKNRYFNLGIREDTIIICGLLHDVCKTNFYFREKNSWKVHDSLPLGHGEKSIYLISKFIELTDEEAIAIRFHMGLYDIKGMTEFSYNDAKDKYPIVTLLSTADLESTFVLER